MIENAERPPAGPDRLPHVSERHRWFLERWQTDVAPVHERTERSREFRTQYAQLALKSVFVANGAALVAFPVIARLIDVPLARHVRPFLYAEGAFLAGLIAVVVAMLLSYITLDADVMRQKGERAAARSRLIGEFPERSGEALEAERAKSDAAQRKYWKIGVCLAWAGVAVGVLSLLAFTAGGILAGFVLATAGT